MKINFTFILFLLISLYLFGCGDRWNEESKKNFKHECEATDNIESIFINLEGYTPKEIDSVLIKYTSNKMTIDSFFAYPIRDQFNALINIEGANKILYKNNIEVHIKGEAAHIISGLKNGIVPQFTNSGEGYGCQLSQIFLDGKFTTKNDADFLTIKKTKESIYKVKHEVLRWTEEEKKAKAFTKPIPLAITSSKMVGKRLEVIVSGVMGACELLGSIEFPNDKEYNLIYEINTERGMAKHLVKHQLTYSIAVPDTSINYNLNLFFAEISKN
jgi:hypothetical protein